jgi:hypothetical protein
VCPACGARLAPSAETAQRVGAVGGLIFALVSYGAAFLVGPGAMWSWQFLVAFSVFALLVGAALMILLARLARYEEVRRARWSLFPNVAGRPRAFLILGQCVIPVCMAVLAFARRLPVWVLMLVSLVVMVAGVFLLIVDHPGVGKLAGPLDESPSQERPEMPVAPPDIPVAGPTSDQDDGPQHGRAADQELVVPPQLPAAGRHGRASLPPGRPDRRKVP